MSTETNQRAVGTRSHGLIDYLKNLGPYATCLIVCTWTVMVFMVISIPAGDYGVFISVAERLKAGDHLYSQVWDNKDPLFYYLLALSRWKTPIGGWVFDVARLVFVAYGAYFLARQARINVQTAAILGLVAVPIIATAVTDPATASLPGLGFAFLGMALLIKGRVFWAALVIGISLFLKITLFPIVFAAALVVLLIIARKGILQFLAGLVSGVAAITALLLLRGDFSPYLDSLKLNFQYSRVDQQASFMDAVIHHLESALPLSARITIFGIIVLVLVTLWRSPSAAPFKTNSPSSALFYSTCVSTLMVFPVLALTGKWPGHGKLLIFPAVLALTLATSQLDRLNKRDSLVSAVLLLCAAIVLAGIPTFGVYKTKLEYARANLSALTATPVETQEILSTGLPTTYARVGQGDDGGHAFGLQEWTLACPRFHQYWWESEEILDSSLNCLPKANVILVASSANRDVTTDRWSQYLDAVEVLLKREYTCSPINYDRICVKKT